MPKKRARKILKSLQGAKPSDPASRRASTALKKVAANLKKSQAAKPSSAAKKRRRKK